MTTTSSLKTLRAVAAALMVFLTSLLASAQTWTPCNRPGSLCYSIPRVPVPTVERNVLLNILALPPDYFGRRGRGSRDFPVWNESPPIYTLDNFRPSELPGCDFMPEPQRASPSPARRPRRGR